MDEAVLDAAEAPAAAGPAAGGLWLSRIAKFVTGALIGLALALAALLAFLDTGAGHRFIVDRIAAMTPESGLRIRIGRIDGSIWGRTQLRDVRLYDPDGLFAESPQIEMDWRPIDFLWNSLVIHELESDLVILHRLPELDPARASRGRSCPNSTSMSAGSTSASCGSARAVTGRERVGSLSGEAEIRSGRALVALDVGVRDGGDRLRAAARRRARPRPLRPRRADPGAGEQRRRRDARHAAAGAARPRRRRQLVALGAAPRGSTSPGGGPRISGSAMASGRFELRGWAAPAPFLQRQAAAADRAARAGRAAPARSPDRRVDGRLSLRSAVAARRGARRGRPRRAARYRRRRDRRRADPAAGHVPQHDRPAGAADGPARRRRSATAHFVYRLTAPQIAFDQTGFEEVRAEGRGRLSRAPVTVPMLATARRVTGVGEVAGGILANLRVQGQLRVTPQRLTGDDLVLTSDKLRGLVDLEVDLRTGVYAVAVNAAACAPMRSRASASSTCSPSCASCRGRAAGHDGDRDGAGLGAAARQPLPRLGRRRAAAARRPV